MKTLRMFLMIAFMSASFASAGDSKRAEKPNEWVRLTKKLIALSGGVYVCYKLVDHKVITNKIIDFAQRYEPKAHVAEVKLIADGVGYGTRALSGLLTYSVIKGILS